MDVETYVNEETGVRVYRAGDVESTIACAACGVPIVPVVNGQRTCGTQRCRDRVRERSPEQRAKARERNRRWAEQHRNCTQRRPWLVGPPPCPVHMPGGGCTIEVHPAPRWPIEHRNVRALHGLLSNLVDLPHQRWPEWALVPLQFGCGWGVYFRQDEVARRLAGRTFDAALFDRPATVRLGPLVRVKFPASGRRGHQRVRIDTITPVNIEDTGRTVTRIVPTSQSIRSALCTTLPERLGLVAFDRETVQLEVVEQSTQARHVPVGGKWGTVSGWVGEVVVDVNAPARWLLETCARGPGLGGRTAIGFGRIVVRSE